MEYFLFLSDLGSFPLVQAGYLIKGRFPFILRQDKSLGLEAGGWRQGPRPGGRNLEAGSWSNLFMEYFSPTVCPLFSGFMFEGRK